MKTLLLISSIALLASCSTAYKSGQTPDDVYYSKPKEVQIETTTRSERNAGRYEEDYQDRQIRMAIRNQRWRSLDDNYDYDCHYNPYSYGYNYGYYYNPYYYPYPVYSGGVTFVNPKNTTIRTTNLNTYSNTLTTYTPSKSFGTIKATTTRGYYDNNNPAPVRNNDTRTYTETRTYTPAPSTNTNSSGNSSSGSSSSGGTTVTRPGRGG
jgi:hypothetical protein